MVFGKEHIFLYEYINLYVLVIIYLAHLLIEGLICNYISSIIIENIIYYITAIQSTVDMYLKQRRRRPAGPRRGIAAHSF